MFRNKLITRNTGQPNIGQNGQVVNKFGLKKVYRV
jgi:hypothetical protein